MKKGSPVMYAFVDHKRMDVILVLIWIMSAFGVTLRLIREWEEHDIL
jgi:hypothetical protein